LAAIDDGCGWRLGGVVLAWSGETIAAVRKGPRPDYAFSNLWALPGGMARRVSDGPASAAVLAEAVRQRASRETGLDLKPLSHWRDLGPIVTEYVAAGAVKRTLVVVFDGVSDETSKELSSDDNSIGDATWLGLPPDPWMFAPANRLIVGHLLWSGLPEATRADWRQALRPALSHCAGAAKMAGVPPPPSPWSAASELEAWLQAWP